MKNRSQILIVILPVIAGLVLLPKARGVSPEPDGCYSGFTTAEGCDALVIATEWDEFKKLDLERARKSLTHPIMFDGRNLFDPAEMERLGFIYKSIGR